MSFRSWLSETIAPKATALKEDIEHGRWTSSRLWLVVGFVAALIWAKSMLTELNMKMIFWLVVTYTICNTVSKCVNTVSNAWIKVNTPKCTPASPEAPKA